LGRPFLFPQNDTACRQSWIAEKWKSMRGLSAVDGGAGSGIQILDEIKHFGAGADFLVRAAAGFPGRKSPARQRRYFRLRPALRPERAAQIALQGCASAAIRNCTNQEQPNARETKGDISNEVRQGAFLKRFDVIQKQFAIIPRLR
jgi:hypothetical protein